jgi:hypothetical protein
VAIHTVALCPTVAPHKSEPADGGVAPLRGGDVTDEEYAKVPVQRSHAGDNVLLFALNYCLPYSTNSTVCPQLTQLFALQVCKDHADSAKALKAALAGGGDANAEKVGRESPVRLTQLSALINCLPYSTVCPQLFALLNQLN